jgi:Voltage gated chloride channel
MVGMAGYFSGVVQARLAATAIVIEMTNNPAMTVPVGAAEILGTLASRLVCREPVYAAMSHPFLLVVEQEPVLEPNAVGIALEPSVEEEEHKSNEVAWLIEAPSCRTSYGYSQSRSQSQPVLPVSGQRLVGASGTATRKSSRLVRKPGCF